MSIPQDLPIGVFDSGIGGLTVLKALQQKLPLERFIYVGDTARVPYGIRSEETVKRYALEIAGFLNKKGIKLLVVACNTASAVALKTLEANLSVPVIGVIEPGARAAVKATKKARIGVIGTETTVKSNSYVKAMKAIEPSITVITKACPLFVPLVEEGWTEGVITELVAERYLSDLIKADIDTLVLGCTHYPLLKKVIQKTMGPGVSLIDSAEETAYTVEETLKRQGLLFKVRDTEADIREQERVLFYVTDAPDRFSIHAEVFLGRRLKNVNILSLEEVTYEKGWQRT